MAPSKPTRVARLERAVALRWTVTLSVSLALLLTAVLSVRMALGQDPALGPKLARQNQPGPEHGLGRGSTAVPTTVPSAPVVTPTPVPAPVTAPAPAPAPVQIDDLMSAPAATAAPRAEHRRELELFGSRARICVGVARRTAPVPEVAAYAAERRLREIHAALTRFEPASELSVFNGRAARTVAVSPLLAAFVEAARDAYRLSDGLVDANVIEAVEMAGYERSRVGVEPASLRAALAAAPARRPALRGRPEPWAAVRVDADAGTVTCDPSMRLDSGGVGKGLAAGLCAAQLESFSSFAVDCGGDLRIGAPTGSSAPSSSPTPSPAPRWRASSSHAGPSRPAACAGCLAPRRRLRHHLIDPGRGVPAWTGLVQATAVAPTAVVAEAIAKAALLAGPRARARASLGGAGWSSTTPACRRHAGRSQSASIR